jgi:hypothetical protein
MFRVMAMPTLNRLQKLALLLIVALGFGLRFGGLDHDLHEEIQYHPDTPKQVRAVQRFLDGQYYAHFGILDYDAYPYLHSHIVEYISRAGSALHGGMQALTGVPGTEWRPDYYQIFWLALGWNALLSTLLILLVFQLARENWDLRAAFAAAFFLAVSPMDVIACHFAGADTTAGFFATVTVFFALRIYRLGRIRDYALAALFAACAFSSKYHAGMALLPVLAAHGLRMGSWRAQCTRTAVGRLGLLGLIGLTALVLTTPVFLTHFTETVRNIIGFFNQVTSFRGADETIRASGWSTKLVFGLQHNVPLLVQILGPLAFVAALLGLKEVFRRQPEPRALILYVLPLCYFLAGGGLRPMAHPIVQTLTTPLVFVAAGLVFTRPWLRSVPEHPLLAGLRKGLMALALGLLALHAARESFLFWHQDTRRLALAWTEENVPPACAVHTDNYSFSSDKFASPTNATGWFQAVAAQPPAAPYGHLKSFSVETDGLPIHRNIPVHLFLQPSAWLQPGFQLPIGQRSASEDGNRIICDNGPEFVRSEKLLNLQAADKPVVRCLVSATPLREAWIGVQNGAAPNFVEVHFGGSSRRSSMKPGEVSWWRIPAPRASWPIDPNHAWYRLRVQAHYGRARVLLATRPEELGVFLFNAGRYADALPCLLKTTAAHPALLATLALICAQQTGHDLAPATRAQLERRAQPLADMRDSASCRQVAGIAPAYLEALDFIKLECAGFVHSPGCRRIDDLAAAGRLALEKVPLTGAAATNYPPFSICSPMLQLDPGVYTLQLRVRGSDRTTAPLRWRMEAQDMFGASLAETDVELPPLDNRNYTNVTATFHMPLAPPEVRLVFKPQTLDGVVLDEVAIKPDVLATIRWLQQTRQQASPLRGALPAPALFHHNVDTIFQGGLRLEQITCDRTTLQPGQALHVGVQFRLEAPGLNTAGLAFFIHVVDPTGQIAFQGDFGLADLLQVYAPRIAAPAQAYKTLAVPATLKAGAYALRVGVCRVEDGKRLRVQSSPLPYKSNAVQLPTPLVIAPP